MNGIVLIDKPAGMTSFKVTSAVRKKLNQKHAGHAGTLDPMATGVLPVMAGQATRLIDLLPSNKKQYRAGFMLGMTTDTLDSEGQVLSDQPVNVSRIEVETVINSFVGEIMQIPPMYSALKQGGLRLYELARQGVEVERNARKITVYSACLLEFDGECGIIDVCCSKGTYIRTLLDDIGIKLGCGAFMTSLRRTQSNGFSIDECISLDEFMNSDIKSTVHPPEYALKAYPSITITDAQAKRFSNGGVLDINRITIKENSTFFRVYSENNFLGLGVIDENGLKPKCVLSD